MSTRSLVILMIAACLALAAWWMLDARAVPGNSAGPTPLFALRELPLEQVNRLRLARPGAPEIIFERGSGTSGASSTGWTQTHPFAYPGDPALLRQVIDTVAALEQSRVVPLEGMDDAARASLGLEAPAAVLELGWGDGETCVLELGRRTVAGRAWVRVQGRDQAASVGAALHELAVEGDPRQWRSLALYDAQPGGEREVAVHYGTRPEQEWVIRQENGRWRIEAPFRTRADGEAVRGYIEALARAQADAFAADQPADLAAFGLASPLRRVRVARRSSTGAPEALVEVGQPVAQGAPEHFARVDGRPAVVQLGAKALAALFPPPAFFIDPRGTDVQPADVRRIAFTPVPGSRWRPFSLERVRDTWLLHVDGADPIPADPQAARRLLAQLAETRAPEVSLHEVPAELWLGQFTLTGEQDAPLAVVRLARERTDGTGKWGMDNEDGVLRVFPQGLDLRLTPESYVRGQ